MMTTTNISACVAAAALLLSMMGCQKQADAPKPVAETTGTSSSSQSSVSAPPSALPPSDASIKPAAPPPAPKTSDAQGPTQATPNELSKTQESGTMPLAGQANNHSTPATTSENKDNK